MSSESDAFPEGLPVWIEIPARDMDKLKNFYSGLFPTWNWRPGKNDTTFGFETKKDGLSGGIVKIREGCGPHTQTLGSGVTVYHLVENLEKAEARAHELGGKTVLGKTAESTNWYMNLTDPEGNRFGIYQTGPPADGA